ncbi:MAG: CDP-alcohol phosphatidyltransferase family protein [Bacteroidetes bacterium]|nr:MAG: CDP-alcohol phosphatidyltransferase family protein [Bacteroidota bacterium]
MTDLRLRHTTGWPELGHFWTIPNMLSLLRLVLTFPIAYLVMIDGPLLWIFALFLLAVATDYFDGRVARWSHTVSDWGKVLDPLADKVGGGLVMLALAIRGSLPAWFVALMLARDALLVLGGIVIGRRTGFVVMSMWWGKVTVTLIALTALAALLRADPPVLRFCIVASTGMMIYSFFRYALHYVRLLRMPEGQRALYANIGRAGTLSAQPAPDEQTRPVG